MVRESKRELRAKSGQLEEAQVQAQDLQLTLEERYCERSRFMERSRSPRGLQSGSPVSATHGEDIVMAALEAIDHSQWEVDKTIREM